MPRILICTLKSDVGDIKKGTTVKVAVANAVGYDVPGMKAQLRHLGFYDDDINKANTVSHWDIRTVDNASTSEWDALQKKQGGNSRPNERPATSSSSVSSEESDDSDSSSSSDNVFDSWWFKTLCTIIPILLVYWILKALFGLILWPFRAIFCSNCDYPWPHYSFVRY